MHRLAVVLLVVATYIYGEVQLFKITLKPRGLGEKKCSLRANSHLKAN